MTLGYRCVAILAQLFVVYECWTTVFHLWTAEATNDLNLNEMQYISDHLTHRECRKLMELLAANKFYPGRRPTGSGVPNVSCIRLLLQWDRTEGRGTSFVELAVRLKQLGKYDLADRLTNQVFDEKDMELDDSLLGSHYKDGIKADMGILSDKDRPAKAEEEPLQYEPKQEPIESWQIAGICLGAIAVVVPILLCVCAWCKAKYKPKAPDCWTFFRQNVPVYLFRMQPKNLPREVRERQELLIAEARDAGDPTYI